MEVDPLSQPYLIEHCMSYTLPSSGWTLQGYSIAGVRTGFRIKEKKILLDAGVACDVKNSIAFITHAHTDHTLNLPVCCTPWRPIVAVCNTHTHDRIIGLMRAAQAMTECDDPDDITPTIRLQPSWRRGQPPEQGLTFPELKDMVVHTFSCYHTVDSTAYGFSEIRKKLKPEFTELPPKELGKLRKSGVELTDTVEVPQLLFCGDTSVEFFERAPPKIWTYPVIMVECTSIDSDSAEESRRRGHMNLSELRPFIMAYPEITFILFHHSQKYSPSQLCEICKDMPNVVLWIGPCYYEMAKYANEA